MEDNIFYGLINLSVVLLLGFVIMQLPKIIDKLKATNNKLSKELSATIREYSILYSHYTSLQEKYDKVMSEGITSLIKENKDLQDKIE